MPTFYLSMPAVILLVLGIAVINDGAIAMGAVMIAVAGVLLLIWLRMWGKNSG